MSHPDQIYKVASRELFEAARAAGLFTGMPIDHEDGYIHFSTATQLPGTLLRHFAGQTDLMLFAIRTEDLGEALRWEPARGGDLFPHLYRELPMHLVRENSPLVVTPDGSAALPDWVR